jgi:hypothetical protein
VVTTTSNKRETNITHAERGILIFDAEILDDLESRKHLSWQDLLASRHGDQFLQLSNQLNTQQARQLLYHARTQDTVPHCACGQKLSWHADHRRYRAYCSRACTARYSVACKKIKNLATIGREWHTQTSEWRDKVRNTSQNKFGTDHYSKTQEFHRRTAETCLERLGVERPAQSKLVQEKMRQTNLERYGVSNAAQSSHIQRKIQITNLERYGATSAASRHISPDTKLLLDEPDRLLHALQTSTVREIADSNGISVKPIYDRVKQWNITIPSLPGSSMERQVQDFIKSHYTGQLVVNDRSLLGDREIDIWLPDLRLAIECNGTYWHCESQGRISNYHLNKTQRCWDKNIDLLHIWEHDWIHRRDIVQSMLMYRLGACATMSARKLSIAKLSTAQCKAFMEQYHLQGWAVGAQACYGLIDGDGSVMSAMSLGQDRFGKTASWELLRFASVLCYAIPGAASKLLKHFITQHSPEKIISYSDRATTRGTVYPKLGFVLDHHSRPNYRYTQDYMKFYSRNRFQKHRLPKLLDKFDASLTEWQNMQANGWDRLWDCGNSVYVWTRS